MVRTGTARVIHYIPDPNMSCGYADMRDHINYQRETISTEELKIIAKADRHFHVLALIEDGAKVIIDQWVRVFRSFQQIRHPFTVYVVVSDVMRYATISGQV